MTKILLILSILWSQISFSQNYNPAKWNASVNYDIADSATIQYSVAIEKGWHIYSQHTFIKNGPIPTYFNFQPNVNYSLIGITKESKTTNKKELAYANQVISYFQDSAIFIQKIVIKSQNTFNIVSSVSFMVCSDSACLAPETKEFTISVNKPTPINTNQSNNTIPFIFIGGFIGG